MSDEASSFCSSIYSILSLFSLSPKDAYGARAKSKQSAVRGRTGSPHKSKLYAALSPRGHSHSCIHTMKTNDLRRYAFLYGA